MDFKHKHEPPSGMSSDLSTGNESLRSAGLPSRYEGEGKRWEAGKNDGLTWSGGENVFERCFGGEGNGKTRGCR